MDIPISNNNNAMYNPSKKNDDTNSEKPHVPKYNHRIIHSDCFGWRAVLGGVLVTAPVNYVKGEITSVNFA